MKLDRIALALALVLCATFPALAYDPPSGWSAVHNRAPGPNDDALHGYFEAGSVSQVICGAIGVPNGAGLTAVNLTVAAPSGLNPFGEQRQATARGGINGGGSSSTAYVLDGGSGYNPASPPAVTVASFTGTTTPNTCSSKVAQTPSIWNELGSDGRSSGRTWYLASSTPGKARWVRVYGTGLPAEAVGGTAPVFAGGTKREVASYVGALFACLPPAGGATTDIPQDVNGEADQRALQAYLTAASATACNVVKLYDQSGAGRDANAGYEPVSATVSGTTTGYNASTTFIASANAANTACPANRRPTFTVTTDSGGNAVSAVVRTPGSCTATSATLTVTLSGTGVGSGTGLTITVPSWYQTGPSVAPVLRAGGVLKIERINDSGVTVAAQKPTQALYLPTTVSVTPNAFTVLIGGYGYSSSQAGGVVSLGTPGSSSVGLQVNYALQSLGSTGFTNYTQFSPSMTQQTLLWEQSATGHEVWQGVADTYFPLANAVTTAQTGGELLSSNTAILDAKSYGGMGGVVIWGRALTLTERINGIAAMARAYNTVTQAVDTLAVVGHSRIEGARSTLNQAFPQKLATLIGNPSLRVINNGLYGALLTQMAAVISDNWAGHSANPRAPFNAALVLVGINDANTGSSGAQMTTNYQTFATVLRRQGFDRVYALTDYNFGSMIRNCLVFTTCAPTTNLATLNAAILGTITGLTSAFDLSGTDTINFGGRFNSIATVTPSAGGTGWTTGNIATVPGGTLATGASAVTYTVTASGGVVTSLTYAAGGPYTVPPNGAPITLTGAGSGLTITADLNSFPADALVTPDEGHSNDLGLDISAGAAKAFVDSFYPPR